DLPLAAAKQLVANRIAVLDEAEIAIFVADDDQIFPLFTSRSLSIICSRLARSAPLSLMKTDNPTTNRCSASEISVPPLPATFMAMLSATLYVFLLIQINKPDESSRRRACSQKCDRMTQQ